MLAIILMLCMLLSYPLIAGLKIYLIIGGVSMFFVLVCSFINMIENKSDKAIINILTFGNSAVVLGVVGAYVLCPSLALGIIMVVVYALCSLIASILTMFNTLLAFGD